MGTGDSRYLKHINTECIKTTSMENVSAGVLEKNKEQYLRKIKPKYSMMYQDI